MCPHVSANTTRYEGWLVAPGRAWPKTSGHESDGVTIRREAGWGEKDAWSGRMMWVVWPHMWANVSAARLRRPLSQEATDLWLAATGERSNRL